MKASREKRSEREREREKKKWDFGDCAHSGEVQCPHADERDSKCTLSLLYVPVTQAVSERNTYIFPKVLLEAWLVWIYLVCSFSFLRFCTATRTTFKCVRLVGLLCGVLCMLTPRVARQSHGIAWPLRKTWTRAVHVCWVRPCVSLVIGPKFWPDRREAFQRLRAKRTMLTVSRCAMRKRAGWDSDGEVLLVQSKNLLPLRNH